MLNTPAAFLAALVLVVAVNSFLYFGFYLPRTTNPPDASPPGERTHHPSKALEKTSSTTDTEKKTTSNNTSSPKTLPKRTQTATATATATSASTVSP